MPHFLSRMAPAWFVPVLLLVGTAHAAAPGGIVPTLDSAQLAQIQSGQQVVVLENITGQPWPRISIYQAIAATPEEIAAVFFDYAQAKNYIPRVIKSVIAKQVSPREAEVDYGLDVPILPDEFYTVSNRVSRIPGGGYLFTWKLLRAEQTKASVGEFRIEPFTGKPGNSIVLYRSLTTPNSKMAVILRGQAISMAKDTVQAIGRETEARRVGDRTGLSRQIKALQQAFLAQP